MFYKKSKRKVREKEGSSIIKKVGSIHGKGASDGKSEEGGLSGQDWSRGPGPDCKRAGHSKRPEGVGGIRYLG